MHEILLPSSRYRRLLGTRRHPDQAAIAARMPVLGRRVPMREYWRAQPVRAGRATRHVAADAWNAIGAGAFSAAMGMRRMAERRARPALRDIRERLPRRAPSSRTPEATRQRRMSFTGGVFGRTVIFAIGLGAGILGMYYFDQHQGRRRRALLRDKAVHFKNVMTRNMPQRIEKRGRFFRGVARGVVHHAADALPFNGHPAVDDETLVARVRSEVLRDQRLKAGEIHIDAYQGCVTLRGQLEHPDEIRKLVRDTAHVEGVREVRNFLHLPGTPPPNKAEVYSRYEVPAHMRQ